MIIKNLITLFALATLTTLILLVISFSVRAEEPPAFLKDAEIVVTLKDGSVVKFSANQWKVVPRLDKKAAKSAPVAEEKKNRVRGLVGYGLTGKLNVSTTPNKATVKSDKGAVGAIGYDRKVSDKVSIGVEGQTNGIFLFGLGLDF